MHCSRVSVYICIFRFRYRTYTNFSTGSTKSSVQRPSRILKHRSPTKRKPTLWRIRLITSDGHFFVSSKNLQTQERHKTQKSHYIITHKRSVFCLHMFCSMLMKICIFCSARVWRSRRSRMMRSRVWVRSAGWVCAQFILEFSYSPVSMDRTDTVYLYVYIQYFVGAWLALRMPPTICFFKTFRCRKSGIQNRKCVRTMFYIFIYTYSCLFIETHCPQEFLRIIINIYKYI